MAAGAVCPQPGLPRVAIKKLCPPSGSQLRPEFPAPIPWYVFRSGAKKKKKKSKKKCSPTHGTGAALLDAASRHCAGPVLRFYSGRNPPPRLVSPNYAEVAQIPCCSRSCAAHRRWMVPQPCRPGLQQPGVSVRRVMRGTPLHSVESSQRAPRMIQLLFRNLGSATELAPDCRKALPRPVFRRS